MTDANDNEQSFHSINRVTGMLQDIEEVREVGLGLATILKDMLSHPFMRIIMPPGLLLDSASYAVMCEGLLQTRSQASFVRETSRLLGENPLKVEYEISKAGLSEELPSTHPDAPHPVLPPLDPNDPSVQSSWFLSQIARHPEWLTVPEQTKLSPDLENFIRDLLDEEEHKDGDSSADQT